MKQVRKAIIPAAGLGTRFLPATKALAKEMLPIVDKPTIQFIVEEARKSGIQDIVVVDGKNKRSIEDHFDSNPELEDNLRDKHKDEMLKLVQETTDINIYFIRQSHPRGLGDAVLTARDFIGDEPFVVMLGDDLNDINNNGTPLTKELIDSYQETGASTLAVMRVPHEDTSKYGVINPSQEVKPGLFNVTSFVEKPDPKDAPSDLAIIGRYVFTPEIFDVLAKTKPGKGNEIQLTDAINTLNKTQRVFAHEYKGDRYDVGNKFGWIETNIEYGLNHPEVKDELREYIKELGAKMTAEDKAKK
ncbi:UTP--glucose-1-phosphate uridylyltransferase GalU [Limosilactobacillus mucosae]|uniref:UTP--glucose-1-phosphate uridylyltransferase n=1 Tax=Limosilactobacillus mucosae TaxID=97478 RepID=A0AAJ1HTP6_LIMMU|nr:MULTISPECIES: UTP--glucose-1-phosphate uridylyltransferase GalU [Lactobacillaceae]MDD6454936.1 UTP--glucose-1-phosphate uridylyltransferase GalU [Lactobacillus sp.]MDC2829314.1 UTP--glucose-1-phosphate uridylyltransferase GalU [Limosilactobacillus mucosae]MDC2836997.1 UTP--glucose-1-phosphate uridylyltransferase GalU [Limosilactobacillus mucosae]MDC2849212.1 UTP--glucose-1-phosphate uridylyltransferase GalU [Limosilactobacillus mucosae]MDC2852909.1 UTP--glucose-1-phosphate uridylyltransfera